jgi:hypothetical protein
MHFVATQIGLKFCFFGQTRLDTQVCEGKIFVFVVNLGIDTLSVQMPNFCENQAISSLGIGIDWN